MIVSKMLKENWRIKKIQNRQIEVEGEGNCSWPDQLKKEKK